MQTSSEVTDSGLRKDWLSLSLIGTELVYLLSLLRSDTMDQKIATGHGNGLPVCVKGPMTGNAVKKEDEADINGVTVTVVEGVQNVSLPTLSGTGASTMALESRDVTKKSQWSLFKQENKQLFEDAESFDSDVKDKLQWYTDTQKRLDGVFSNTGIDCSKRYKKIIHIVGTIYEKSHVDKVAKWVKKNASDDMEFLEKFNNMLRNWANYHLGQVEVLLVTLKNDCHTVISGGILGKPLFIESVQEIQGQVGPGDEAERISVSVKMKSERQGIEKQNLNFGRLLELMETAEMFSPIVQYETDYIDPAASNRYQDTERTLLDEIKETGYAQTARRILWNKNFTSLKSLVKSYSELFKNDGFGGFMVTTKIAKALNQFCLDNSINRVVNIFSGIGMLQAAMKSINSEVATTSLDAYSGKSRYKSGDGGRVVFYEEYDQEGIITEEYAQYFKKNRSLVTRKSCLLVSFPDLLDKPLKGLQNALRIWGLLGGGVVVVLSEVTDKSQLYGDLFSKVKIKNSSIKLPEEVTRTLPHITPHIFTLERRDRT
nr:hypothetical protein [Endozoicomonas sp.]